MCTQEVCKVLVHGLGGGRLLFASVLFAQVSFLRLNVCSSCEPAMKKYLLACVHLTQSW